MKKNNIKTKAIAFAMAVTAVCSVGAMSMTSVSAAAAPKTSVSTSVVQNKYSLDKSITWSWSNPGNGKGKITVKNFNANYDYRIIQYNSKGTVIKTISVTHNDIKKNGVSANYKTENATSKVEIYRMAVTTTSKTTKAATTTKATNNTAKKTTAATTKKESVPTKVGKYTQDKLVTWSWNNPGNGKGKITVKNFKSNYDYVIIQYDRNGKVLQSNYYTHSQAKKAASTTFKVNNATSIVEIYSAKV